MSIGDFFQQSLMNPEAGVLRGPRGLRRRFHPMGGESHPIGDCNKGARRTAYIQQTDFLRIFFQRPHYLDKAPFGAPVMPRQRIGAGKGSLRIIKFG